jgi:hypothetical protein
MFADFFRTGNALIDRNRHLDFHFRGHRFHLQHDVADHVPHLWIASHLHQRCPRQRTDRVESDVAQDLHPNFGDS